MEDLYIAVYDTINNKVGYNRKRGGANGRPSEATRKLHSKFSQEEIEQAVALYNGGMSASAVEKQTGMSYGSVIRSVKKLGFKIELHTKVNF